MYIRIDNKYKMIQATNGKYLKKGDLYSKEVYVPVEEDETLWSETECAPEDEVVDPAEVIKEINNIIDGIV